MVSFISSPAEVSESMILPVVVPVGTPRAWEPGRVTVLPERARMRKVELTVKGQVAYVLIVNILTIQS
jgi:hypothetical protein